MKQLNRKFISEFLLGIGIGAIVFGAIWLVLNFRIAPEPPGLPLSIDTTATVLSEPMTVPSFQLTDHHARPFTENNLQGQWTFLFFGYTYCPDICPTTLALLKQVDQLLRDQKTLLPIKHPRFVFISVDPARDTTERLAEYVSYFNPAFLGVTGLEEQLQALTQPLGIAYRRAPDSESNENYLIEHSSSILLVNPQAQLQALISPPHDATAIAEDYRKILDRVVGQN
jgi:protein SCO1/2